MGVFSNHCTPQIKITLTTTLSQFDSKMLCVRKVLIRSFSNLNRPLSKLDRNLGVFPNCKIARLGVSIPCLKSPQAASSIYDELTMYGMAR